MCDGDPAPLQGAGMAGAVLRGWRCAYPRLVSAAPPGLLDLQHPAPRPGGLDLRSIFGSPCWGATTSGIRSIAAPREVSHFLDDSHFVR
jgi:hypothetical protein